MKTIFDEITLKNGAKLNNRIAMAPMTTWGANDDHSISDEEINFYTKRAKHLGLLITGCTHVSHNGIGFENEFSAYDDKFLPGLTKLAQSLKPYQTKSIVQINHAGNKALAHLIQDEDVVSASAIETLDTEFALPSKTRALTEDEIYQIIKDFGLATKRIIAAGFDGVEIHGAHGFLIQNFMSPYFNQRTDKWGGSLENRARFALEIVKEIQTVIKTEAKSDFILGYRLSPDEPMANALRVEDNFYLIDKLIDLGIDYIHISLPDALNTAPVNHIGLKQIELLSSYIANRCTSIVAGNLKDKQQLEEALNYVDMVAIGRSLLTDPDFVSKLKAKQPIIQSLDLENTKQLALPNKLVEEIIKNKGWIAIQSK